MRKVIAAILFCFGLQAANAQFAAQWNFQDFTQNSQPVKAVYITPLWNVTTFNTTNIIVSQRQSKQTESHGTLIVSNMIYGGYRVEFIGTSRTNVFTNCFDVDISPGSLVDAAEHICLGTNMTGASDYAYTRAQSDKRFMTNAAPTVQGYVLTALDDVGNYDWEPGGGSGGGASLTTITNIANTRATAATNGYPWGALYDALNAALNSTNGIGLSSGLSAFRSTNTFITPAQQGILSNNLNAANLAQGTVPFTALSTNVLTATNQPFAPGQALVVTGTNPAGQPVVKGTNFPSGSGGGGTVTGTGTGGQLAVWTASSSIGDSPYTTDDLLKVGNNLSDVANTSTALGNLGGVPTSRTLTVAGTANQITSSAGAQDLSANRTATLSLPSTLVAPGSIAATTFFGLDQWIIETNAVNHSLFISNTIYGGNIMVSTNGVFSINGAPLINATALGGNQIPYTDGSTNLLSSTNSTEFEFVIAPSSNATNYSLDFSNAHDQEIHTGNTNANITFANASTNHSIDLYINALTSTVPCTVTFPPHIRLNHFASLSVSNTTAVWYHINFWHGTDPTNAVVIGGDYEQIQ